LVVKNLESLLYTLDISNLIAFEPISMVANFLFFFNFI
jgi:hypothetical protein